MKHRMTCSCGVPANAAMELQSKGPLEGPGPSRWQKEHKIQGSATLACAHPGARDARLAAGTAIAVTA